MTKPTGAAQGRAQSAPDPLADTRQAESAAAADPNAFDTERIAPSLPTALFERYRIRRKLGAGGMGVVYEALDLNLHRVVALKVLKLTDEDPGQVAEAANRLVREARAMAVLSHRNVVAVYDVGMHGMQVYVAMQLVDGVTLRQWIAGGQRTVSQILRVLCDAGAGLAAAHRALLVHRDFKPDNVLVSKRGSVRVTDFGLARRALFDDQDTLRERSSRPKVLDVHSVESVTRSGAILGTPAYMPPEQTEGRPCDARSDQFSFCVAAWEALYGVRPFAGTTWSELYANVISGTITEPDPKLRVPRPIQKALRRGLSVDPAERFASMEELLAILRTGIEKRRPWLRYLVVPAVSAALAGGLTYVLKSDPAPAAATATPTPAPLTVTPLPQPPAPAVATPAVVAPAPTTGEPAPAKVTRPAPDKPKPRAKPHAASTASSTTAELPAPASAQPAAEAPVDPLLATRTQRKAIDRALAARGLRRGDLPATAATALADAEDAIAGGDAARADGALAEVDRAIGAIVIDHAFINAKLARINKQLEKSTGREEEFRALYVKLKALVQAHQYAEANALLNDMADRLAKK